VLKPHFLTVVADIGKVVLKVYVFLLVWAQKLGSTLTQEELNTEWKG
jgi:hypothetical protein